MTVEYDVFLAQLTSNPAVAERPHNASCLSVVSFNSTIHRAQSSIISYYISASNKFCSLLLLIVGVHADCDKQDSLMPSVR